MAFHSAKWNSRRRRDLGMCQVSIEREVHHPAGHWIEMSERIGNHQPFGNVCDHGLSIGEGCLGHTLFDSTNSGTRFESVGDTPSSDSDEPRTERALRPIECLASPPRRNEHLLRHILRIGVNAEHTSSERVHEAGPARVRIGECSLITGAESRGDLGVVVIRHVSGWPLDPEPRGKRRARR